MPVTGSPHPSQFPSGQRVRQSGWAVTAAHLACLRACHAATSDSRGSRGAKPPSSRDRSGSRVLVCMFLDFPTGIKYSPTGRIPSHVRFCSATRRASRARSLTAPAPQPSFWSRRRSCSLSVRAARAAARAFASARRSILRVLVMCSPFFRLLRLLHRSMPRCSGSVHR